MPEIQDDKAHYVVPFILDLLAIHQRHHSTTSNPPPFIIGLNGVQGAGKTVLVSILQKTLGSLPHNLPTLVFSLDDLYLTHDDQLSLAAAHPLNPLLQHRGQPSTHDIPLARSVFSSLKACKPTSIPQYNKAAFSGQGDRVPSAEWPTVNTDPSHPIRVVIFEGWSVGFRPLSRSALESKHAAAVSALHDPNAHYDGRLGHNTLESVMTINSALRDYDDITDQFDAFVHIDAADPQYVYEWRLEQEAGLRKAKASGMTDEEVRRFVDGYYPAYELYTETLRRGVFRPGEEEEGNGGEKEDWKGRQLRLVVGKDRKVREAVRI
jgi:D-glycerate 3-kinase